MKQESHGLRHTLTGVLLYAASNVCALGFTTQGKMPLSVTISLILITSIWSLGVLFMIYSGKTQNMRDPFITAPQVIFGLSVILWATLQAPALSQTILLFSAIPFLFGALGLKSSQFTALTVTTTLGYSVVLLVHELSGNGGEGEWLSLTVVLVAIPTISMLCSYIATIRNNMGKLYKALSIAHQKTSEMVDIDELTGLYTRRYIKDRAQYLANLATRGDSLCVCMLDVDHFKRVNDTYGHDIGDKVLQSVANVAAKSVRNIDVVGRWGGEEFIVLVHGNLQAAESIAARIRNEVSVARLDSMPNDRITVSIGVTLYQSNEQIEATIKRADEGLYQAKHQGRDRIVIH